LAKSHRLSFPTSDTIATVPLQLIHCDVKGPSPVVSNLGYRYYVMFTDYFSCFSWIYFCSHKSDVTSIFTQFKLLVENVLDSKIKTVQISGGTEFQPMIRSHPTIQFYISCPYTPQKNKIAERKHRHVVELSLASMFQASISQSYWPEIFESVVFVINCLSSSSISFDTLYNLLFHKIPDY
jgi:hypothetical protein